MSLWLVVVSQRMIPVGMVVVRVVVAVGVIVRHAAHRVLLVDAADSGCGFGRGVARLLARRLDLGRLHTSPALLPQALRS